MKDNNLVSRRYIRVCALYLSHSFFVYLFFDEAALGPDVSPITICCVYARRSIYAPIKFYVELLDANTERSH